MSAGTTFKVERILKDALGNELLKLQEDILSGLDLIFDKDIAQSQTNLEYELPIKADQLKMLVIHAEKAILIETNDGATPAHSFDLAEGDGIFWSEDSGLNSPLDVDGDPPVPTDVDSIFLTTGAVGTGRLRIWAKTEPAAP